MIRQNQLPSSNGLAEYDPFGAPQSSAPQPDESPVEVLRKLHRLLRGRYILALTLAAVGALGGGAAGYFSTEPKWQSIGAIRIEPMGRVVLGPTENTMMPMFESYVRDQIAYLEQDETIIRAMMSDEWRKFGRGLDHAAKRDFRKALTVNVDRDNWKWIKVRFVDKVPEAARVGVREVIDSYKVIFGPKILLSNSESIVVLERAEKKNEDDIRTLETKITRLGEPFGTIDLGDVHNDTLRDLREAQDQLDKLDEQIRHAKALSAAGPRKPDEPGQAPAAAPHLNALQEANEISRVDPMMAQLIQLREAAYNAKLRLEKKYVPGSRQLTDAEDAVKAFEQQIVERKDQWMAAHNNQLPRVEGPAAMGMTAPVEVLEANRRGFAEVVEKKMADANLINRARSEIGQHQEEIKAKREELTQVKNRLSLLSLDSAVQPIDSTAIGRVQIVSDGEEPSMYSDSRKKLGAIGFLLGGSLPIIGVMLLGSMDRRYRYSDDAQTGASKVPLLGILPYLPDTLNDPDQAGIAAHCVHQIRTLLQIGGVEHDRKVFAITSATSGDGKTSLCLSLGLSFAASGANTCLIDFDMIGGGLTAAMGDRSDVGLLAAIDDGQLDGHVRPTAFPRLSIIPAGRDDAQEISRLSPKLVRRLIEQARKEFDVVIIDTGPILGSIEATLVCGIVDGVVLALGRGQQRSMATRAIDTLRSVGAHIMGVVFNRAQANDFKRTVSQSVRSVPVHDSGGAISLKALPAMGPVARTVVSHIRSDP